MSHTTPVSNSSNSTPAVAPHVRGPALLLGLQPVSADYVEPDFTPQENSQTAFILGVRPVEAGLKFPRWGLTLFADFDFMVLFHDGLKTMLDVSEKIGDVSFYRPANVDTTLDFGLKAGAAYQLPLSGLLGKVSFRTGYALDYYYPLTNPQEILTGDLDSQNGAAVPTNIRTMEINLRPDYLSHGIFFGLGAESKVGSGLIRGALEVTMPLNREDDRAINYDTWRMMWVLSWAPNL